MLQESIIKQIEKVPPLPDSIIQIEALFAKDNLSIKELIRIVEKDPVLTANILALANSSFYSFSKSIVSVQQAVTLFGLSTLRGFILSSIAIRNFEVDITPYGLSNTEFQELSVLQSNLMFQWYMTIDIEQSGILVPIAFLMDIGKIIIAREIINNNTQEAFRTKIQEATCISDVEKEFTGMTSAQVTALLFKQWNFNEIFSNVIINSDDPYFSDDEYMVLSQAVDVVKTCINVREVISERSFKDAKMKSLGYGLSIATFIKTVERIQKKLENG